jgi:hypothetical protein
LFRTRPTKHSFTKTGARAAQEIPKTEKKRRTEGEKRENPPRKKQKNKKFPKKKSKKNPKKKARRWS